MRPTVLCTLALPDPFTPMVAPVADIIVLGHNPQPEELREHLARQSVDVLCPQVEVRVTADVLEAAGPRLRAVNSYAVGYNHVDLGVASALGVAVANTPGVLTDATADLAMGLLLAAARRIAEGDRVMRAGLWTGWTPDYMLGLDLRGSLLGIIGFGRIGQAVARRALAFGMRVGYLQRDSTRVDEDLVSLVIPMDLESLIAESDVLSLHCQLNDSTRHLINETRLRSMKPTAVLVNTARGAVVDEPALVQALQQGWIAAAGLDVYEDEPNLPPGLVDCSNAVLSPHLGSSTQRTRVAMAELCALNTLAALRGELPPHCVNVEAVSTTAAWLGTSLV